MIVGDICPTILFKSRLTKKLQTINSRGNNDRRIIIAEMLMCAFNSHPRFTTRLKKCENSKTTEKL